MINLILGQTVVLCFWICIALICGQLLTGYADIFICVLGLVASSVLVFRLTNKKEVSHDFISKINNDSKMSNNKIQELSALKESGEQVKEANKRFPGMQITEVKQ